MPLFADLRRALAAYRAAAPSSSLDLSTLLSASPPLARRVLAEGVWEQRQAEFLAALPDVAEDGGEARAWYLSVSSPGAGEWLRAIPVSDRLRAPSHIYRLALLVRFGADIPEFVPTDEGALPCGALRCTAVHDRRGHHPSVCSCANREALLTDRHNALQLAVLLLIRGMGQSCRPVGHRRLFGSAGTTPSGGHLYTDLYCHGYRGAGRHLFIDVGIVDPAGRSALADGSATTRRRTADQYAAVKRRKYEAAVAAVAGDFRPAIVERSGAVGDDMHGLLRMFAGDGEREHGADDDWYFSAPSRVSYFMQHVVFATVMADASMLDSVIGLDVGGDRQGGVGAAQGPGG